MFSNLQDGDNMVTTIWSTTWKLKEKLEEKPFYMLILRNILYVNIPTVYMVNRLN